MNHTRTILSLIVGVVATSMLTLTTPEANATTHSAPRRSTAAKLANASLTNPQLKVNPLPGGSATLSWPTVPGASYYSWYVASQNAGATGLIGGGMVAAKNSNMVTRTVTNTHGGWYYRVSVSAYVNHKWTPAAVAGFWGSPGNEAFARITAVQQNFVNSSDAPGVRVQWSAGVARVSCVQWRTVGTSDWSNCYPPTGTQAPLDHYALLPVSAGQVEVRAQASVSYGAAVPVTTQFWSPTASVTVAPLPTPHAGAVEADTIGAPVTLDLAAATVDPDGLLDWSTLRTAEYPAPRHGTVVYDTVAGTITYTPNLGDRGDDQFTYIVCQHGEPTKCTAAGVWIYAMD